MNYNEFIRNVSQKVDRFSAPELCQIFLQMAEKVSVNRREAFLEQLCVKSSGLPKKDSPGRITLKKQVDELAKQIEGGDYCTGWGWDDALHDERDWGDESWADEMDRLLADCRKLVLNRAFPLAEELYGKLLGALDGGYEPGHLPGDPDPCQMLEESVEEHMGLYLAATYMNTPRRDRPRVIQERLEQFDYLDFAFSAEQINGCVPEPLPDFDMFLSDWLMLLVNQGTENETKRVRDILSMQDNAAIAAFARQNYRQYPIAWLDWVDRLKCSDNQEGALEVLQEGLSLQDLEAETRAQLADRLARLTERMNRTDMNLEALQSAYESSPNLARLVRWLAVWRQDRLESEFVQMIREKTDHRKLNDLLYHTLILTGDVENARLLTGKMVDSDSTFRGQNLKSFLVAHLLYSLTRPARNEPVPDKRPSKKSHAVSSNSNAYRNRIATGNAAIIWDDAVESVFMENAYRFVDSEHEKFIEESKQDCQLYLDLIDQAILEQPMTEDAVERILTWCRSEVDQRVSATVDAKHRSRYHEAARLLAAIAEAMTSQGKSAQAQELIIFYQQKYRRFSAFKAELAQVR